MSMYADYLLERQDVATIEIEHGFATYKKLDDATYYLMDIYVKPSHRRLGVASELSAKVYELAKNDGAKSIIGSVDITAKGVTQSMKAILSDGFVYSHSSGNGIYFVKTI